MIVHCTYTDDAVDTHVDTITVLAGCGAGDHGQGKAEKGEDELVHVVLLLDLISLRHPFMLYT